MLLQLSNETPLLPSVTSVINTADSAKRDEFLLSVPIKTEPLDDHEDKVGLM